MNEFGKRKSESVGLSVNKSAANSKRPPTIFDPAELEKIPLPGENCDDSGIQDTSYQQVPLKLVKAKPVTGHPIVFSGKSESVGMNRDKSAAVTTFDPAELEKIPLPGENCDDSGIQDTSYHQSDGSPSTESADPVRPPLPEDHPFCGKDDAFWKLLEAVAEMCGKSLEEVFEQVGKCGSSFSPFEASPSAYTDPTPQLLSPALSMTSVLNEQEANDPFGVQGMSMHPVVSSESVDSIEQELVSSTANSVPTPQQPSSVFMATSSVKLEPRFLEEFLVANSNQIPNWFLVAAQAGTHNTSARSPTRHHPSSVSVENGLVKQEPVSPSGYSDPVSQLLPSALSMASALVNQEANDPFAVQGLLIESNLVASPEPMVDYLPSYEEMEGESMSGESSVFTDSEEHNHWIQETPVSMDCDSIKQEPVSPSAYLIPTPQLLPPTVPMASNSMKLEPRFLEEFLVANSNQIPNWFLVAAQAGTHNTSARSPTRHDPSSVSVENGLVKQEPVSPSAYSDPMPQLLSPALSMTLVNQEANDPFAVQGLSIESNLVASPEPMVEYLPSYEEMEGESLSGESSVFTDSGEQSPWIQETSVPMDYDSIKQEPVSPSAYLIPTPQLLPPTVPMASNSMKLEPRILEEFLVANSNQLPNWFLVAAQAGTHNTSARSPTRHDPSSVSVENGEEMEGESLSGESSVFTDSGEQNPWILETSVPMDYDSMKQKPASPSACPESFSISNSSLKTGGPGNHSTSLLGMVPTAIQQTPIAAGPPDMMAGAATSEVLRTVGNAKMTGTVDNANNKDETGPTKRPSSKCHNRNT